MQHVHGVSGSGSEMLSEMYVNGLSFNSISTSIMIVCRVSDVMWTHPLFLIDVFVKPMKHSQYPPNQGLSGMNFHVIPSRPSAVLISSEFNKSVGSSVAEVYVVTWLPVAVIFGQQIGEIPVVMMLLRGLLLPLSALLSMWHMWINRCMPCPPLHCVASRTEKMVALPILSSLGLVLLLVLHMVYHHTSYKQCHVTVSSHTGIQLVSRMTVWVLTR